MLLKRQDVGTPEMDELTTKDGFLPQGAKTSNYLANLVFWKHEHSIVEVLTKHGWRYSRLTDDITASTAKTTADNLTYINRMVIAHLQRHGFRTKRSKHKVLRNHNLMTVNSLAINEKVALPKAERKRIRAQVHQTRPHNDINSDIRPSLASTRGKIEKVARMHPRLARTLLSDLQRNIQKLDEANVTEDVSSGLCTLQASETSLTATPQAPE
jgi:hypothetical protein